MEYIITANTDIGIKRGNNQDSLLVKVAKTPIGRIVLAVLCDGMGGFSEGEVASASLVKAFDKWFMMELPQLCREGIKDYLLRMQWESIVAEQNELIRNYGINNKIKVGTTVVAMLLTPTQYFVLNIGDSRVYEIENNIRQITKDHSLVAKEVERGNLTWEQAECDKRKNILLQCVGVSKSMKPDMFTGSNSVDKVYMICSDGFRHMVSQQEFYMKLNPKVLRDKTVMDIQVKQLIELNKIRGEKDNISAIVIKTMI